MTRSSALTVALALVIAMAGCTQTPGAHESAREQRPTSPAVPKRIVAGIRGSTPVVVQKMNTGGGGQQGTEHLEYLVHAGLLAPDPSGTWHPRLAEAVPTIENGLWKVFPDGRMETTWKLKPNLKWHDGTALTAEDVVFTSVAEQTPALAWTINNAYDAVERVEAPDPLTVLVRWKQPFVEADQLFSPGRGLPMPRHLLERALVDDPANFLSLPYWGPQFVGAGPYKMKEYELGSHFVLSANDDYVLGRPKIDTIEVRFIGDGNAIIANLLAGEIQYTMDGRTLTFEDSLTVRQQWQDGHFELGSGNVITMFPQFMNPRFPNITNKQVRKALMHALNRQEMVDTIQGGQAQVADLYLGPDQREYPYVERNIVRYPYDPRRAAQLIEDAGYVKGADGYYSEVTSGERLTEDLRLGPAPVNQKPGLAVADYWQRVGVAVDLSVLPLQRQQDREYNNSFPGFYLIRTGRGVTDFISRHSARQPLPSNDWTGTNRGHYVNPEFDALADRYFVTIPFQDRMGILAQLVRIDTDDVTTFRLYFDPEATAVANRLKNVPPGAPWNAHEWELTP